MTAFVFESAGGARVGSMRAGGVHADYVWPDDAQPKHAWAADVASMDASEKGPPSTIAAIVMVGARIFGSLQLGGM